jgi:alkanesulfonate monooxygenase SsuD/methylene tetrahydromethanopterin reductase-like flavin-dependent oxidoreductase (luciferase family)
MRIDLILESNAAPENIAELGRLAERYGLGGIWVSSMLDARDPFMNFAELARTTSKIRMGPIAVSPYELHPLKMATSVLTLNEASRGRAQIVVGGGGGTMTAMALKPERRVRAVREAVEILKLAGSGEKINYEGEIFTVRGYHPLWAKSPPPVIYVGANREKMLHMGPRYADGIMLSDKIIPQVREARAIIDKVLDSAGRPREAFRMNNFWAWHVKETREEAQREARIWLALRGVLIRANHVYFMNAADCDLVEAKRQNFFAALRKRSPDIEDVPERIIETLVENLTSCASIAEIDKEIERLRQFEAAGLTEIALRIYDDPAATIKLIGERVIPALAQKTR